MDMPEGATKMPEGATPIYDTEGTSGMADVSARDWHYGESAL
jgi:hypothetical protein